MRTEFEHYDLGYVSVLYDEIKMVEVELNYAANVCLMEDFDFSNYKNGYSFNYYGGRATSSPVRIKIPDSGWWHVVIDNGGDSMSGIISSCGIRTISNY